MKSLITILIAMAVCLQSALGEELHQTVRGTVVESLTGAPIMSAAVVILDTKPVKGAKTGRDGSFKIQGVPVGRYNIRVSSIGYKPSIMTNIVLSSAKECVLEVKLEESITKGQSIKVSAEKAENNVLTKSSLSGSTFTVEEAQRYAGSLRDPARMASGLAGAMSSNDQRNEIVVRGNSPTGFLWRLEGLDIPNPSHFATNGTTGGGISILNSNNLADCQFMTGAFPSEIGNTVSGAFDLKLRKGNNEKHEYTLQAGVMGIEAGIEGPIGGGSSYAANYRYSTFSLVDKLGGPMDELPGIPHYQDIVFNIDLKEIEGVGKFSIFGLAGKSEMKFKYKLKEKNGDEFSTYDEMLNKNSSDDHLFGVFGISHSFFFSENTVLNSKFGFTGAKNTLEIDTILNPDKMIQDTKTTEMKYIISSKLLHKFDSQNRITLGFAANFISYDYLDSLLRPGASQFIVQTKLSGNTSLSHVFVEYCHRFSDELAATAGLHLSHLGLNNSFAAEPRADVRWKINEVSSLSFAAGLHSQAQPFLFYLYRNQSGALAGQNTNKNLGFSRSAQAVIGYEQQLSDKLRLKAEGYFQYHYDIPVENVASSFSMLNVGGPDLEIPFRDNLRNGGTGKNYGIELTLEKQFSNNYYYMLTGSVYESKYKGSDGVEHNTVFNGNFALNILGGTEISMGKGIVMMLDGRISYIGGRNYTPILLEESRAAGYALTDDSRTYEERYSNYFRADLKLGFRMNFSSTSHTVGIDVFNVTDQKNVFKYVYNPATKNIEKMYQYLFFPNIYYKLQF